MKPMFTLSAVTAFLVVATGTCFADWGIEPVSSDRAKELGMELRSKAAGPNDVAVELEFKLEGALKDFSRVDLRVGKGEKLVSAALKEDRSKPGRVAVSIAADRTRLDELSLWVFVPEALGGTIYEVRVNAFVEPEKRR